MKHVLISVVSLSALPAMAHSGVHFHPHGAETWGVLALAVVTVFGTMFLVGGRAGKGRRR